MAVLSHKDNTEGSISEHSMTLTEAQAETVIELLSGSQHIERVRSFRRSMAELRARTMGTVKVVR